MVLRIELITEVIIIEKYWIRHPTKNQPKQNRTTNSFVTMQKMKLTARHLMSDGSRFMFAYNKATLWSFVAKIWIALVQCSFMK